MLFNSLKYTIFFPFIYPLFWKIEYKYLNTQISLLLILALSWIFFRSEGIEHVFQFINRITQHFHLKPYRQLKGYRMLDYYVLIFITYKFIIQKKERSTIQFKSRSIRYITHTLIIFNMLLFYDDNSDRSFIYFQF